MSADIVTDYVYSSHCSDCFVFGPQSVTEEEAVAWADSHDSENHEDAP